MLRAHGWAITSPLAASLDPWTYQAFFRTSRAEWTVAKDQNVRLRSGWFSERAACYLATGKPVITQSTGFENVLPTGTGLFAFRDMDEIGWCHRDHRVRLRRRVPRGAGGRGRVPGGHARMRQARRGHRAVARGG